MKNLKLWIPSLLLIGLFFSNASLVNAGCTQIHISCPEEEDGVELMCNSNDSGLSTCYEGGCLQPVRPYNCSSGGNEQ